MKMSFKKWLSLDEVVLGSDGVRDNQEVQTAQGSEKVASSALSDPSNADTISTISRSTPKPVAVKAINTIAGNAIRKAGTSGKSTTTPKVASVIANNVLGRPKAGQYFPAGVSLMKKQ
jgi:hypothetical protein